MVRVINEAQAAVVRRIFTLHAQGRGFTKFAKTLNAEQIPPPRDSKGWAPSAIREMLDRTLYRGELVWNQRQKVVRGGTKRRRLRPTTKWVRVAAPDLQIVPDALCGVCGGALIALTRDHGKQRGRRYWCSDHHKRGATICGDVVQIPQATLDAAVLQALSAALDERTIEATVEKALAKLRATRAEQPERRAAIERELFLIKAKVRHLVAAISRGEVVEPLLAALKGEEARKATLTQELAGLEEIAKIVSIDTPRLQRDLKARAAAVRALLARHIPQARQMLR